MAQRGHNNSQKKKRKKKVLDYDDFYVKYSTIKRMQHKMEHVSLMEYIT